MKSSGFSSLNDRERIQRNKNANFISAINNGL